MNNEIDFIVNEVIEKIKELPIDTETTIGQLLQIKEIGMIDPLTQGTIFTKVKEECEKIHINLKTDDELSGLAYNYKFKKELILPKFEKTKIIMTTESIDENGHASGSIKEIEVPTGKVEQNNIFEMTEKPKEKIKMTREDKKLMKYFKKFEKKFGRKPYIPEPGGTREQTIQAIKTCLKKKEDIFDELVNSNKDVIK